MTKQDEKKIVYLTAVIGLISIIVIAVLVPEPSAFQYGTFRLVISLCAAGFIAFVPGFLDVRVGNYVRAGGAIAAFVLVYFWLPA